MNPTPDWLKKLTNLPELDSYIRTFGGHKQAVTKGWSAPLETHFAFEIIMIISGSQTTRFSGMTISATTGDIMLIPPGIPHENLCDDPLGLEYFCLHFDIGDPSIQHELLMYCPIMLSKTAQSFPSISSTLLTFISLLDKSSFTLQDKLQVEISLFQLIYFLLDYSNENKQVLDTSSSSTLVSARLIAETIRRNFRAYTQEPTSENSSLLSIAEIAKQMNMSQSTMLTIFKKVYSISPKQYLDQIKFNEAKFLLQQPQLSIAEITEIIGYQNASHFSRQFKFWSGLSPKNYQEMMQT